jgi:hypothetical protein
MTTKTAALWLLIASLVAASAMAASIEGVEIPDSMESAGIPLALNGAGIRNRFFVDVYVAGLYLQRKSTDGAAIVAADEPMVIKLRVITSLIDRKRMQESIEDGFDRSAGGDTAAFRSQIDALKNAFTDEIAPGDVFDLAYVPGKGLEVSRNGTHAATVPGDLSFKRVLFGIWLSDRAVQPSLRRGLLGR